ncbi:hypothetical protein E4U55_001634 [Claviceps digitariae]|nr:hypothetical protein E4U55_001634 [Claviceps digitariae]
MPKDDLLVSTPERWIRPPEPEPDLDLDHDYARVSESGPGGRLRFGIPGGELQVSSRLAWPGLTGLECGEILLR